MSRGGAVLAGLGLVVVLAVLLLAGRLGGDGIDASVMGTDGLRAWLSANGVAAVKADAHAPARPADYALRVLPLYDIDLRARAARDEAGQQQSPREMTQAAFNRKLREMPSLVILPKWRLVFARTAVAWPEALIGVAKLAPLLRQIGLAGARLVAPGGVVTQAPVQLHDVRFAGRPAGGDRIVLYHPQLFARDSLPRGCVELAGLARGALLLRCRRNRATPETYYLSDPDLLDNHGLSLGDNAAFAVTLLKLLTRPDSRPILLDPVPNALPAGRRPAADKPQYSRSTADLARLLRWPLSAFWAIGLLVAVLAFWRGARRFGPVRREDAQRPELSKRAAIEAQARLLRLAGTDREMARDFVQARLAELARQLFGPHAAAGSQRLWARLARRDAEGARALRQAAEGLLDTGGEMRPGELMARLRKFGELLEKMRHGAG
jgi:hypothetical protein